MKAQRFSVPSKTYFVGEYSVLRGGPCLILATEPRFVLTAHPGERFVSPFHTQSPAGRYCQEHPMNNWRIEFSDPHQGRGGFGASSAQLLMAMALQRELEDPLKHARLLLKEFDELGRRNGFRSSGGDMMAQIAGGLLKFRRKPFALKTLSWTLPELDFVLIRTGVKVPTHWHVRDLAEFSIDTITAVVDETESAFARGSSMDVIRGVREFRQWLRAQGFEAQSTTELLVELERSGIAVTAKGCGAMGADVVLVLVEKEQSSRLIRWAKEHRLDVVATTDDLSAGFRAEPL